MSWPNRDGYYSFLMHLGPFGCIATAIFSENTYIVKTRFQDWNYVAASRAHLVQFDGGFAIFHTSQGTQEVWKIAKKPNHLAKFGCGSGNILKYFFQKIGFHFSKNHQNYNKIFRVTKKLKNYSLVPIFWYMFCGTNNFFKKLFKKIIF